MAFGEEKANICNSSASWSSKRRSRKWKLGCQINQWKPNTSRHFSRSSSASSSSPTQTLSRQPHSDFQILSSPSTSLLVGAKMKTKTKMKPKVEIRRLDQAQVPEEEEEEKEKEVANLKTQFDTVWFGLAIFSAHKVSTSIWFQFG